jgi:hypothetical protein
MIKFDSQQVQELFFRHCVQTGPGAHNAAYAVCAGRLTPQVKWPRPETTHSLIPDAEVKNA